MKSRLLPLLLLLAVTVTGRCQDKETGLETAAALPDKWLGSVDAKAADVSAKLTQQTGKYLQRMSREEQQLRRQLRKKDSAAANRVFAGSEAYYQQWQDKVNQGTGKLEKFRNVYSGHLDSMQTALNFLQQNKLLSGVSPDLQGKVTNALGNMEGLQGRLNQTGDLQKAMADRQTYLQDQLGKLGMTKDLDQFKQTIYYYRAQIAEYKKAYEDPSRLEAKALETLSTMPAFRDFFQQHSELASLFNLSGSGSSAATGPAPPGMQTRDMLTQDMLQRFGSAPNVQQAVQQGMGDAQSQMGQLKDKLKELGAGGGSDKDMPDFKPNSQKTRTFFQRLEYGANIQTTRSNNFFPATSDFALSVGYKINEKSIVGIGASYKMGWGKDISHLSLSNQGIGFRSFLDIRLKGNFWVSGGGELNYQSTFSDFQILKNYSPWQKSALLGLSKKYKVGNKLNGNMQLLYDFLYNQQIPARQPLVFRVGYTL